jgi:hypothetical protein
VVEHVAKCTLRLAGSLGNCLWLFCLISYFCDCGEILALLLGVWTATLCLVFARGSVAYRRAWLDSRISHLAGWRVLPPWALGTRCSIHFYLTDSLSSHPAISSSLPRFASTRYLTCRIFSSLMRGLDPANSWCLCDGRPLIPWLVQTQTQTPHTYEPRDICSCPISFISPHSLLPLSPLANIPPHTG